MDAIRTTQPGLPPTTAAAVFISSQDSVRIAAEALTVTDRAGTLREAARPAAEVARIAENTGTTATISAAARRLQDSLTSGLYGVIASAPLQPAPREAEPVHVQRIRAVGAYEATSRIGADGAHHSTRN